MRFVTLRFRAASPLVLAGEVVLPGASEPSSFFHPDAPLAPGPLVVFPAKMPEAKLRAAVKKATVLAAGRSSHAFVRRKLVEKLLGPSIAAGDVVLREVLVACAPPAKKLGWTKGILSEDFVYLDVRARFPADRATLPEFAFKDPRHPYATLLTTVPSDHTFGPGREPRAGIFRIGEGPNTLWAEASLFQKLQKALGGALEHGEASPGFGMISDAASNPPFPALAAAEAAANAFYRGSPKDRKTACMSPIWAYWFARLVDGAPSDETRTAASRHPYYACAYARDVDHGPHDVTRAAAANDWCAAREYILHVERAATPATRKALMGRQDVELQAHENARRFDPAATQPWHAMRPPTQAATAKAKAAAAAHVLLGWGTKGVVTGNLRCAGARVYHPWTPRMKAPLVFVADEYSSKGRLRKRLQTHGNLAQVQALRDGEYGPFIVRRSSVSEALRGVPEVALVPVTLRDAKGKLDDDFVLLDVRAHAPIDREASSLTYATPKAPNAGDVRLAHTLAWSRARTPPFGLFAVAELPHVVMVDEALCRVLEKATGGALHRAARPPTQAQHAAVYPPRDAVDPRGEPAARAASDALWELVAKPAKDARLRATALGHPLVAVHLALTIDRGPANDTRRAALGLPEAALAYAILVDRAPRTDTRRAAAARYPTAYGYIDEVDLGFHPVTKKAFDAGEEDDWDAASIRAFEKELSAMRRDLGRR